VSEAALASAMALEPTSPLLVTIHAIVEATATKFGLTFRRGHDGLESRAVAARKIGAALVVRRLEIEAAEVAEGCSTCRATRLSTGSSWSTRFCASTPSRDGAAPDVLRLIIDSRNRDRGAENFGRGRSSAPRASSSAFT
jgi:hypothetical protein